MGSAGTKISQDARGTAKRKKKTCQDCWDPSVITETALPLWKPLTVTQLLDFLVVQWFKIHLPIQETQEDLTVRSHKY